MARVRRLESTPVAVFDPRRAITEAVLELAPGDQALAEAIASDYLESFPGLGEPVPGVAALRPLVYTIKQAATVTKVGRSKLYTEIKAGRLDKLKIGDRTLIRHEAILKYLDDREREAIADTRWRG